MEEGCSSLKPTTCSRAFLDVVDHVNKFDSDELNLHLNKGCYTGSDKLDVELNNAPASCNPPCFRIVLPGEYCYMGTRNNNFSNRRHMGKIIVTQGTVFPKFEYGSKSHPGKSCKDIKNRVKEKLSNGIYWITIKKGEISRLVLNCVSNLFFLMYNCSMNKTFQLHQLVFKLVTTTYNS